MTTTRRTALAALGGSVLIRSVARSAQKATAFGLIGDRYHNSDYARSGLNRTIARDMNVSIDFCDETKTLNAETLDGYKMLIILRDGMIWPDGYPDERTNAAWAGMTDRPELVSEPAVPPTPESRSFG